MEKENVDRNTAMDKLGINEDNYNTYASCSTVWKHYTSSKKVVDKTSKVSLTISPYVKVKNCSGNETIVSVSSAKPGHAFYGLFQNSGRITTIGAVKASSKRINVHASGYIKPILGGNRYFNYSNCIYAKSKNGSSGCF